MQVLAAPAGCSLVGGTVGARQPSTWHQEPGSAFSKKWPGEARGSSFSFFPVIAFVLSSPPKWTVRHSFPMKIAAREEWQLK